MPSRSRDLDSERTGRTSSEDTAPPSDGAWAVVLAGGDGTRLQRLTRQISGDTRPKQFCKLTGGDSLLRETSRRIAPLFTCDRQIYVVTRVHEPFYRDELSTSKAASVFEQPSNRGTAVAIAVAALHLLNNEPDPFVVFFPSDHHYANESAFVEAISTALSYSRRNPKEIVLLAAEPHYPEVEYGWIEPGQIIADVPAAQLLRVTGFWEKPSLTLARTLLRRRCLWNTFVTIGRAATFIDLLRSRLPDVVSSLELAVTNNDLDRTYRGLPSVDMGREVFNPEPSRLLAFRDTESGWTDLGTPRRVFDTLARNEVKPEWLSEILLHYGALHVRENQTMSSDEVREGIALLAATF